MGVSPSLLPMPPPILIPRLSRTFFLMAVVLCVSWGPSSRRALFKNEDMLWQPAKSATSEDGTPATEVAAEAVVEAVVLINGGCWGGSWWSFLLFFCFWFLFLFNVRIKEKKDYNICKTSFDYKVESHLQLPGFNFFQAIYLFFVNKTVNFELF